MVHENAYDIGIRMKAKELIAMALELDSLIKEREEKARIFNAKCEEEEKATKT